MTASAALATGTVRWHIDAPGHTVKVTLAPSVPLVHATGPDPATVVLNPEHLDGGTVTLNATDDPDVTPTGWTWVAHLRIDGQLVLSFPFVLPAGEALDLADLAPVRASTGVPVVRGPKGDTGPAGPAGPPGVVDPTAVTAAVDALIGGAPGTLDTLNELAAAIGDDANFAATISTALAAKADQSALATKADLTAGRVPDAQLPTRLADTALRASFVAQADGLRRRLLSAIPPRALAFPKPMPPGTISKYGDSDTVPTSITNPYLVPFNPAGGPIRWSGPAGFTTRTGTVSGGFQLFNGTAQTTATYYASTGGEVIPEFATDAPYVGILAQNHSASPWWVEIDGWSYGTVPQSAPGNAIRTFEFGTREMRHIRIRAGDGLAPAGVLIGRADSISAPLVRRPLVAAMGDSYWGGWPAAGLKPQNLRYLVGQLLGWDFRSSQVGGTGYIAENPANTGDNSYSQRVSVFDDIAFDGGLFMGGLNDGTTGFQAGVASTLGHFRDEHPSAPMFVTGPWSPSSTAEAAAAYQTKRTALIAETANVKGYFIDTAGWVYGTGNRGATAGNGNADILINPDATHLYEPDGTAYVASRLASAITDILRTETA